MFPNHWNYPETFATVYGLYSKVKNNEEDDFTNFYFQRGYCPLPDKNDWIVKKSVKIPDAEELFMRGVTYLLRAFAKFQAKSNCPG